MVGYSGTPLARKLGFKPVLRVALRDVPLSVRDELRPELAECQIIAAHEGEADMVLAFLRSREALSQCLEQSPALLKPSGSLWVAWPKRSSGMETDITENVIRDVALPLGLVDNKVCAIDETWSGLRLVVRRELRASWGRN